MKESTEQKILKSAMEIFVQKGRFGAKMQEIANAADINKAMLHYYFRSKDQLYTKVFEHVFIKNFGVLHLIFETDESFRVKLHNFIDQYTAIIIENPQIPLFILQELRAGAKEIKPIINKLVSDKTFTLPFSFLKSIQTAIQNKEIKPLDPRQLLITILGSVVFYFIAEPLLSTFFEKDAGFQRKTFIEERKKAVEDIIFNGIKP